jgi:hypothetical protein
MYATGSPLQSNILPGMGFGQGFTGFPMGGASFGSGLSPAFGSLMQTAGTLPTGLPGSGFASFSQGCPGFGGSSGGMDQMMMMMVQAMMMMTQFLGMQMMNNGAMGAGTPGAGGASPLGGGGGGAPSSGGGAASGGAAPAGGASSAGGTAPGNDTKDKGEIQEFIAQAARTYGADPKVLTEMARRESGFQTGVVNDWDSNAKKGTPSKGLFQFIEPTFKSYAAQAKKDNPQAWASLGELNWNDWRQQALAASWAVAHGHGSAWSTYSASGGH